MRYVLFLFLYTFCCLPTQAQELYPMTEPASSVPAGVLGIRAYSQSYAEVHHQFRNLFALKAMYGVTAKLSVMVTGTVSNHHSKLLPPDFPDHNTPQIGVALPYRFNGVHAYAKYRFLSKDAPKKHFRMAAYAEYGFVQVAHDEAEPSLLDDTRGFGAGIITTYLSNRFAASFTGGIVLPSAYKGDVPDFIPGLAGVPARVEYGRAAVYNLSFGYRLFPHTYTDYNQTNWNVYVEFLGKSYEAAQIFFENIGQPGSAYPVTGAAVPALGAGHYVEIHPGIQAIIRSNLRLDVSVGFPLIRKSYTHFYPLYSVGIQRYFFFKKSRS